MRGYVDFFYTTHIEEKMLTIKRLISALFVVFFVSYTNVALAVKCSDGYIAQQGDTSCQPCDWGEFCYAGESTATASGSTQRYKCDVQSGGPYYLYQQLNIDSYLVSSKSYSSGNTGCLIQMNGSFVFKNGSVVQCGEGKHAVTSDGSQCNIEVEYSSTLTKCTCVETERSVVAYFLNGNTNFWVQPTYGVNLSLNKTFLPSKGLVVPEKPWPTQNEDMTATYSVYENSTLYNAGPFSGTIPNDSMPDAGIYISANWNDGFPFEFKYSRDPSQYTTVGTYPSFDNTTVYNYEGTTSNFIMLQATTPCAQIYFEKPDLGDNYVFIGWGGATTSDDYFRLLYDSDGMPLNKCATVGNLSSSDSYYDGAQNGKISLVDRWWTRKYKIVENLNYDSATDTAKDTCSYSYRTWSNIPDYCLLSAPDERPGYTFSGWAVQAQKYMLKSDATNNASEYVTEDIVENGKMITIAQPGQSFFTWAGEITAKTAPNGNNDNYAKIIATAQWEPNTYTITFDPETGDGVSAENVDFDGSLPQITPPARLGYKFLGYYDGETKYYDENGTAQFDAYTTPSDVTLTAQWTPNKYTITFNPGTGDGGGAENVDFGSALPETIVPPSRLGYGFSGYYNGSEQYYDATGARQVEKYTTASDLELTAQWTPNTYTITFYPENGGAVTTETVTFDAQYPTAPSVAKTGYTFVGWFDSVTGGTQYYTDDGATYAVADDLKLYAQWTPNSFTIIYNGNGATGEMSPTTCTYDQSCFVADNAFTKTYYKFAGWQMTDGTPVAVGADFTNKTAVANDNIILVAQWSLDTLDCQLGKYYNGTDFVDCPAGKYCPGTGSVTVGTAGCSEACPEGYDDAAGAESQEDCAMNVPAGSYLANAGDSQSTLCPLGHYCPGNMIVNYGHTSEIYGVYGCYSGEYADEKGLAQCKTCPVRNSWGAITVTPQQHKDNDGAQDDMTDCTYGFGFAEQWYFELFGVSSDANYNPNNQLNQRGFFTVHCQYNSNTNDYDTNCYANFVGYCADGYYSPQSQDATTYGDAQNVMYENVDLNSPETWPCQPVGGGWVSPGLSADDTSSTDAIFASLKRNQCPNDGLTDTDTASDFSECYLDHIVCHDGNGGTGTQKCYYDEIAGEYNRCTKCEITQCPAGQYMDNGCVDCPVGQYCPGGTSKPVDCPEHSSSFGGASSCACDSGYELPNGNSNNVTTDACSPKTYIVTYRVGQVPPFYEVTFGTEHTTRTTSYPQTGRTQTGWYVMMPTYLSDKVFGMGETFRYNVTANMDLGPKYRQNQFNLIFQNGGAYNADEYRLPKGVVAEYDRRLPDISSYGKIELRLLESETDAGEQLLVSDGWSFDQKNKAWNYDGTNAENYPIWNTDYGLPIEDGTTVNVYPFWKTSALRCNAGYYIPNGDVGNRHCAICLKDQACPGWKELQVVGRKYGMFKCPDNSTSNEQSAYCTCIDGFNTTGRPGDPDKIYPTIENGFNGQSCQQIKLNVYYDLNDGEGYVKPDVISAYAEHVLRPLDSVGTDYDAPVYRAGHIFMGWGKTSGATDPVTTIYAEEEDITVYAIWKPCEKGTYMVGQATPSHKAECDACPETYPNTVGVASTDINQCYVECDAQIDVTGGVAFRDNETEFYGAVCTYSRGQDENGNGCVVIEGVCVHTDCEPEYEMKNGRCEPCARKYALSYNPNGNCRVESCVYGYHPNGDKCEGDTIECDAPNADNAQRVWNSATNSFGACVITKCSVGFHVDANACVSDTRVCKIENGIGEQLWDAKRNRWGDCVASRCEPGYTTDHKLTNERWKDCGRCNNMFGIDGDVAVSSYINDECEIATCMYQGEKYILEDNECRLICGDYSDETGHRYWDDKAHECVHICNAGYLQW